jgi:hypothetical protein
MTPDAFRKLALSLPDTCESSHLDHPDTAWGKGGWRLRGSTNVRLRPATQNMLRPALAAAWRNVASATLIRKHAGWYA